MNNTIKRIRNVLDRIVLVKQHICAFLLIIMLAITFLQVVMRFVFNAPFSWSEEMTLMFLVWFGYICMSIDIYHDSHAALYFLYNKLPPVIRKGADLMRHGVLTWLFVEMSIYGMTITRMNLPKLQPATRFSQGWLFAPLLLGGIFMAIYAGFNFLAVLLTPLDDYKSASDKSKTIDELNVERGGTV